MKILKAMLFVGGALLALLLMVALVVFACAVVFQYCKY